MPLIQFDIVEGRTENELNVLLQAVHEAMVSAFNVPEQDRYQIVNQHKPAEMIIQDTGLGFTRSSNVVVISMTSKKRTAEQKETLYRLIAENLHSRCNIHPEDIMINITENGEADWSFGLGEAQFLNGKL